MDAIKVPAPSRAITESGLAEFLLNAYLRQHFGASYVAQSLNDISPSERAAWRAVAREAQQRA